jgi:hypothetical protein
MSADTQLFSKVRLEMLCDGIFVIVMRRSAIALTTTRLTARR